MNRHHSRRLAVAVGASATLLVSAAAAQAAGTVSITGVASPQPKAPGLTSPNVLGKPLADVEVARGSHRLENGTTDIPYYGYLGNGPLVPAPNSNVEASKTEPDKNTYLVLAGQTGGDPTYNYGTHFLFQGHEAGAGYITRINLDADGAHRITLVASTDVTGAALPIFDGSTWDPFAQRLLFTSERGASGGVWQSTTAVPAAVTDISGVIGRGGYEGVQNDSLGNVYLVEDVGGVKGVTNSHAKQPNSYLYRFVPVDPTDLTLGGRLQVLQVISQQTRSPILFHDGQADADITSQDVKDLHTYGSNFGTRWVTIHDTATAGTTPFDSNALARPVGTPFKRPENGVFKPFSKFTQFFFTETGDTDLTSEAGQAGGGFGGIFRLTQDAAGADTGILSLFFLGDQAHTGLDNIQFTKGSQFAAVEDAGDTLHTQRNALDSGYLFETTANYATAGDPLRFLAEGRDASATLDSGFAGSTGFQNDGDNEITGIHVSDGDPTTAGVLGAKVPQGLGGPAPWRTFWTAQHGDNVTFQIIRKK